MQDVSIGAIIERHKLGTINYRAPIIKFPVLKSTHGQQPTMEVVVLFHPFDRLLCCHQHYSIMEDKEIILMKIPFHQVLCFLHNKPDQISDPVYYEGSNQRC